MARSLPTQPPKAVILLLLWPFFAFSTEKTTYDWHLARKPVLRNLGPIYSAEPKRRPEEYSYFESILRDTDLSMKTVEVTKNLEAPVLNPSLSESDLHRFLLSHSYRALAPRTYEAPGGGRLHVRLVDSNELQSAAFMMSSLNKKFLSLHFDRINDVRAFARRALEPAWRDSILWKNPMFEQEVNLAKRWRPLAERHHRAVKLVAPCDLSLSSVDGGVVFVPDLHDGDASDLLITLLHRHRFSWAGLEESRDLGDELRAGATTNLKTPKGRDIFAALKRIQLPYLLLDYPSSYFVFPVTDTAYDDFIMATRNKLWVDSLPPHWRGVGIVFGGQAHVVQTLGYDFQDFFIERFPDRPLQVIDIHSSCR